MDSSSSASSSSALSFPATSSGTRPRWPDLPIYQSTPHYPAMDSRLVPNSSNYAYDYASHNRAGGSTEKTEEEEGVTAAVTEREHMFDKVVTPSDVGKLNRLVIPKQHAEKYFPLDSNSGDSKGLLLNFEDRSGKSWRFRYSYWNSSQSYVMTKGWSRFVKEKKLDAGDVVSFHRGVCEKQHFYIDWRRRRPDAPPSNLHHYPLYRGFHSPTLHRPFHPPYFVPPPISQPLVSYNGVTTNNFSTGCYGGNYRTLSPNFCHQSGSVIYLGSAVRPPHQQMPIQALGIGSSQSNMAMVFDSVPVVVHGAERASSKQLRLFGVNMDCTDAEEEPNRHQIHHDLVHDSDQVSSSSGESGLQLSLHGSGVSAVNKGKSSMSLDLDL